LFELFLEILFDKSSSMLIKLNILYNYIKIFIKLVKLVSFYYLLLHLLSKTLNSFFYLLYIPYLKGIQSR